MSAVFFREELEGVATYWRIFRKDGAALGFTSHDRDLYFDGFLHLAAPGMVPSSIRRTSDLSPDSAEVEGVLSHGSITARDLALGRYDGAAILVGAVNWETLEWAALYNGTLGSVIEQSGSFKAELQSAKAQLEGDFIPRTSPTCRARFCGPGCTLSSAGFTRETSVVSFELDLNAVHLDISDPSKYLMGELRWLDGPQAGIAMDIVGSGTGGLVLSTPLSDGLAIGTRARLREGCDRTLSTCAERFGNAINFQGEPFLPGNDLLARYPLPQ